MELQLTENVQRKILTCFAFRYTSPIWKNTVLCYNSKSRNNCHLANRKAFELLQISFKFSLN